MHLNTNDSCGTGLTVRPDNTNADRDTRMCWIKLARERGIPIRCVWLKTSPAICEHNDAVRANNPSVNPEARESLPKMAFTGFTSRFAPPRVGEGFEDVTEIPFQFRGTEDEYNVWGRYWL